MFLNAKLLKKALIFLGLIQFISIESMQPESETIKLTSSDNKEFSVNKKMIISLSGLVESSLHVDEHATEIPIPGVSSRELGYLVGNSLIQGGLLNAIYNKNEEQIDKNLSEVINKIPDDELIELISESLEDKFNEKKKLEQICEELGLYDTVNVIDYRTKQLSELYQLYKYAPHLIDVSIFQDVVIILSQYEPRGIF